MLTPESTGVENKAVRPPVYGPGTFRCLDCKLTSQFFGRLAEPPKCPDCKKHMVEGDARGR